ncbi:hypothetical protein YA38_06350 [Klebsiella aerogenes]|nr:hypothetical protein YA38_06350 [Klebsiella aerogenes]
MPFTIPAPFSISRIQCPDSSNDIAIKDKRCNSQPKQQGLLHFIKKQKLTLMLSNTLPYMSIFIARILLCHSMILYFMTFILLTYQIIISLTTEH